MGMFDLFKKKIINTNNATAKTKTAQSKTYICARCKKEITDSESNWIGNHRFCSDCAAPPKNVAIEPKQERHTVAHKNTCSRCGKELPENQLIEQYNKCLCGECVEQVGLINKQIEIVEKIVDEYVSCNNLNLSPCFIENVKTRVKNFLLEYRDNPNRYYVFYWSEYPMGAIHNKVLIKIDSIWHIVQDDYDKKPSEKRTPFPEINDENLVTYLVKFIIEEGR